VMIAAAVTRWAIRWRIELAITAGVIVAGHWLVPLLGGWCHYALVLLTVLALVAVWPAGRAWLVAHSWCLLTRHRIRSALGQAGVTSIEGRLPYVVRVRPTPVGTQVTLWMRAGTALEQLGDDDSVRIGIVRAACWAREVRTERSPRWAHLVRLHLVRHDSLAPSVTVTSTLPDLLRAAAGGTGRAGGSGVPNQRGGDS
jgi:hypothetical protein